MVNWRSRPRRARQNAFRQQRWEAGCGTRDEGRGMRDAGCGTQDATTSHSPLFTFELKLSLSTTRVIREKWAVARLEFFIRPAPRAPLLTPLLYQYYNPEGPHGVGSCATVILLSKWCHAERVLAFARLDQDTSLPVRGRSTRSAFATSARSAVSPRRRSMGRTGRRGGS